MLRILVTHLDYIQWSIFVHFLTTVLAYQVFREAVCATEERYSSAKRLHSSNGWSYHDVNKERILYVAKGFKRSREDVWALFCGRSFPARFFDGRRNLGLRRFPLDSSTVTRYLVNLYARSRKVRDDEITKFHLLKLHTEVAVGDRFQCTLGAKHPSVGQSGQGGPTYPVTPLSLANLVMESPVSLFAASDTASNSTPGSETSDPAPVNPTANDPSSGWDSNWGNTYSSGWGIGYSASAARWGTEHLTRSTVLQTVRSDFASANLTALGTEERNTSLDELNNQAWPSIQLYRSSEQGHRDHAPYPTFTLPQVEQRYREVQEAIRTSIQEKEVLKGEIEAMTRSLAEKKKKAKEIQDELTVQYLKGSDRYHKKMSEVGVEYRELATSCLINQKLMHLSRTGHVEREKFKISLAEYLRKGLAPRDYATDRPKNLLPDTMSNNGDPEHELTPQQKARKRYEERNKEARLEKARERMAKRRASDPKGDRDRQKRYEEQYRRTHREERRYGEDRRRSILFYSRYIEKWGPRPFTNYCQHRNGRLQRPEDYAT
ncbi:hypothetical protein EV360DRAFT_76431 [Lentinula raphanica]|nr:hypothetical protein EV360DRAFT_76431 [Lentinula raphanica]